MPRRINVAFDTVLDEPVALCVAGWEGDEHDGVLLDGRHCQGGG